MSEAVEKRSEAERIRYNKMVDPDWKPSDDTWTGRQKILDNLRKRNTALDPKNDPEMLSTLRNKLNINPTNAEVERRLRARRNARLERDRLSAGEAEGAIAGEKAEALMRLRAKELASSRTPQAYDDHRIKSKQRYDKLTSSDLEREADTEKALRDANIHDLTNKETRKFKDYKMVLNAETNCYPNKDLAEPQKKLEEGKKMISEVEIDIKTKFSGYNDIIIKNLLVRLYNKANA